jgi:hypothetical protein
MSTALSSHSRRITSVAPSMASSIMDDIFSDGRDTLADQFTSGDTFVPQTLIVPSYRSVAPTHRSEPARNATFVIGLASGLAFFGPAPSIASEPTSPWRLGAASMRWFGDDLVAYEGLFAPAYESRELFNLTKKIDHFLELPADWDGDDGIAPSKVAGDAAKSFLNGLSPAKFPQECHAVGDGEIVFQWRSNRGFVEVAFDGTTISWYTKIGNFEPQFGDDPFKGPQSIDRRLRAAIDRMG